MVGQDPGLIGPNPVSDETAQPEADALLSVDELLARGIPPELIEVLGEELAIQIEQLSDTLKGNSEVVRLSDPMDIKRPYAAYDSPIDDYFRETEAMVREAERKSREIIAQWPVIQVFRDSMPIVIADIEERTAAIETAIEELRLRMGKVAEDLGIVADDSSSEDAPSISSAEGLGPDELKALNDELASIRADFTSPAYLDELVRLIQFVEKARVVDAVAVGCELDPAAAASFNKIRSQTLFSSPMIRNQKLRPAYDRLTELGRKHEDILAIYGPEDGSRYQMIEELRARMVVIAHVGVAAHDQTVEIATNESVEPSEHLIESLLLAAEAQSGDDTPLDLVLEEYVANHARTLAAQIRLFRLTPTKEENAQLESLSRQPLKRKLVRLAAQPAPEPKPSFESLAFEPDFAQAVERAVLVVKGSEELAGEHEVAAKKLLDLRFQSGKNEESLNRLTVNVIIGILNDRIDEFVGIVSRLKEGALSNQDPQVEKLRAELPQRFNNLRGIDLQATISLLNQVFDDRNWESLYDCFSDDIAEAEEAIIQIVGKLEELSAKLKLEPNGQHRLKLVRETTDQQAEAPDGASILGRLAATNGLQG